jgi:hypothetical protein
MERTWEVKKVMASQAPVNDQLWWDGPIDKAEILIQGVKMEFILN